MDREITVSLTPRLLRWTLFYQFRQIIFIFGIIFFILIIYIFNFISRGGVLIPETCISYSPILIGPLLIGFLLFSSYSKNLAQIQKMKSPSIKYRMTDEWLYVQSELGSGQNAWAAYKEIRKNAKLWRVVAQSGVSYIIPVELLDEELKTFLSAKLPKSPRDSNRLFKTLAFWLLASVVVMYFLRQSHH